MVSYKLDKYDKYFVAFVLVILVIFNIGQCFGAYTEESLTKISNIRVDNSMKFISANGRNIYYKKMEKNTKYLFEFDGSYFTYSGELYINLVKCDQEPGVDVPFEFLLQHTLRASDTDKNITFEYYNYNDDDLYFVFSPTGAVTDQVETYSHFYSETIDNNKTAINDLVENVGPQQLWSVFESGIDFVGVVVLVVFGLFLIVLLIKKLSKGKSDF